MLIITYLLCKNEPKYLLTLTYKIEFQVGPDLRYLISISDILN